MKSIIFVITLFIISITIQAQSIITDTSVNIVAFWKMNDKVKLRSVQYTNQNTIITKQSFDVDVTIIDSGENFYVAKWYYFNPTFTSNNADVKAIMDKIMAKYNGMTIQIKTTESGEFLEVLNWKEVRSFMSKQFDMVIDEFPGNKQLETMMVQYKKIYDTKESIEKNGIPDISYYYNYYGFQYDLNKPLIHEGTLPNFLGGKDFPSTFKIELTDINKENKKCTISQINKPDNEAVAKAIEEYTNNMIEKKSEKININKVKMADSIIANYNCNTTWFESVKYERVLDMDKTNLTSRIELSIIK